MAEKKQGANTRLEFARDCIDQGLEGSCSRSYVADVPALLQQKGIEGVDVPC